MQSRPSPGLVCVVLTMWTERLTLFSVIVTNFLPGRSNLVVTHLTALNDIPGLNTNVGTGQFVCFVTKPLQYTAITFVQQDSGYHNGQHTFTAVTRSTQPSILHGGGKISIGFSAEQY